MSLKFASLFGFVLIAASMAGQSGAAPVRPPLGPPGDPVTTLWLTTDYLARRPDLSGSLRGASWIRLEVTFEQRGRGKGTLEIDPNIQDHNAFGDPTGVTEMATRRVPITVRSTNSDDPTRKGRRVYEIMGKGLPARLFLVVSPLEAGPNRLLVGYKGGNVEHVLALAHVDRPVPVLPVLDP